MAIDYSVFIGKTVRITYTWGEVVTGTVINVSSDGWLHLDRSSLSSDRSITTEIHSNDLSNEWTTTVNSRPPSGLMGFRGPELITINHSPQNVYADATFTWEMYLTQRSGPEEPLSPSRFVIYFETSTGGYSPLTPIWTSEDFPSPTGSGTYSGSAGGYSRTGSIHIQFRLTDTSPLYPATYRIVMTGSVVYKTCNGDILSDGDKCLPWANPSSFVSITVIS